MKTLDGIEDMIALARRHELSPEDLDTLDAMVQSSVEARLLMEAGNEFDAARAVVPGDELSVERLARFAVHACGTRARPRRGRFSLAARVSAGVLACGAAAAGAWSAVGALSPPRASLVTAAPRTASATGAARNGLPDPENRAAA